MSKLWVLVAIPLFFVLLFPAAASNWTLAFQTPGEAVCSLGVYKGKLFAGTQPEGKIYVYDGHAWSLAFETLEEKIWALGCYKDKLYAGGEPEGILYIYDGENWLEGDSLGCLIYAFATYGDNLFVATTDGVFEHDGEDWQLFTFPEGGMRSLVVYNNYLYAGTETAGAVYRYFPRQWQLVHDYVVPNSVPSLAVYQGRLVVGTGEDGGVYLSDGESQTSLTYDVLEPNVWCMQVYADNLFCGVGSPGAIYTFNGSVWSLSYRPTGSSDVLSLVVYENKLYAGTDGGIYCLSEFDFSLSASPENLSLILENEASSTITLSLLSSVSRQVFLTGQWVGTAPRDLEVSFSRTEGSPPFTATLIFRKGPSTSSGNFVYRVTATGDGIARMVDLGVKVLLPPSAPQPILPENGVCLDVLTPTFSWSGSEWAENYEFELATDNLFSNVLLRKLARETFLSLSESEKLSYGTVYYWRIRGVNAAGAGGWSPVSRFTAKISPPRIQTMWVENGASFTRSTRVTLVLSAQNAVEVSFSSDGVIWSDWQPYSTTFVHELTGQDGEKRIYARVRDNGGDISPSFSTSIILDRTPPVTTHSLSGEVGPEGYKYSAVVTLSSMDALSGVSFIEYWVDGVKRTSAGPSVSFAITGEGKHVVEYRGIDGAGNAEETRVFEVNVYAPSGTPKLVWGFLTLLVAGGAVAVAVARVTKPARRLRKIREEKEQLLRMRKEAETKF
ncbi:MAG: hypothetical protein QXR87_07845, partial [Candidatus Hadarchaeales archaeon]